MSQKDIGLDPIAVTSPFQSADMEEETINDIRYIRTAIHREETISDKPKSLVKRIYRLFMIFSFYHKIKKVIVKEKPKILHAHAMFFCGLPAIFLGKKFSLPVIYEVRSLWMLKKDVDKGNSIRQYIEKILLRIELYVMKRATTVVAINDNLKAELIRCGISAQKIEVIKNAVNTSLINKLKKRIEKNENNGERCNFGYVGTLTPHEGIDLLIDAFAELNMALPHGKLLIYGSGIEADRILQQSEKHKNVHFMGPISPAEVYEAFGKIDIIVNPRYKNKLTDSVTPLKPLEAMAYEKIVVGSDVGGIKELMSDKKNGFLFEAGNKKDLLKTMRSVANMSNTDQNKIKAAALNYVMVEKSWLSNAKKYREIYNSVIFTEK